jgi:hypothetical protein
VSEGGRRGGAIRGLLTRPERLLPLACIAGAVVLFLSELMTTFEFTPPGGEPLCTQDAISRHAFAPGVLALFAIAATVIAVLNGSKPAATAVAICGVIALAIFLILDLPDANSVGTVNDSCGATPGSFASAEAVPKGGFWLELIGSLALAVSGAALASLTPEQLRGLRPRWLRRDDDDRDGGRHHGADLLAGSERYRRELGDDGTGSEETGRRRRRPRRRARAD